MKTMDGEFVREGAESARPNTHAVLIPATPPQAVPVYSGFDYVTIDAQRRRAEADVGPVRYLAELIGMPASDLERPVRLLTLALVAVLDPMAVALLLAAGAHTTRAGSR